MLGNQGQHCLLYIKTNMIFREGIQFYLETITEDPSKYTMAHPKLILSNLKEESICTERVNLLALVGDVYCMFVTFPCGILGQEWYLIVSFLNFSVFLTLKT